MAVPANLFKHALSLEAPKRVALVDALLASLDQADKAIGLKRLKGKGVKYHIDCCNHC